MPCQHFVLPQDLGETVAAGMWLEAYQLTRGHGFSVSRDLHSCSTRRSWTRLPTQRLSGNVYVPGCLHGRVSTLLSRQAFHHSVEGGNQSPSGDTEREPQPWLRGKGCPSPGSLCCVLSLLLWPEWRVPGAAAAAAAKSLQSCPTLLDPIDCSSPGSSVHGIFQVRLLDWVVIAFSGGIPTGQ